MNMAPRTRLGPIAWMARNSVAANLLMLVLIFGGIYMMLFKVKQEYLPSGDPDTVTVSVALPGATPAEVEQSIVLATGGRADRGAGDRQADGHRLRGIGLDHAGTGLGPRRCSWSMTTSARRWTGSRRCPRMPRSPRSAERAPPRGDGRAVIYGETTDQAMRMAGEQVRAALLAHSGISQVDIVDQRDLELHVEIPDGVLRAHGLTLDEVAQVIRQSALDRAGGTLETSWRRSAAAA